MLRSFADGAIFGEVYGDGEPAVLALHGWGRTHHDFAATFASAPALPAAEADRELNAIAIDLPGFGASPAPKQPWSTADYAQALAPLFDQLGRRPVIVGHSFGGLVAVRLAKAFAGQIGALVLTGVPLFRADRGPAKIHPAYRGARLLARAHLLSANRLEASRQRYGSLDYRMATGIMREILVKRLGEKFEEDLEAIEVPVALVWGDRDTVVPLAVAHQALALLVNADLTVVEAVGHLLPTAAPDRLRQVIVQRLS